MKRHEADAMVEEASRNIIDARRKFVDLQEQYHDTPRWRLIKRELLLRKMDAAGKGICKAKREFRSLRASRSP